MTKTLRLTGGQVVERLRNAGFAVVRRRGSHVVMRRSDGRVTVAPVHAGEILGRGPMSKIQRDIAVDREAFLLMMRS